MCSSAAPPPPPWHGHGLSPSPPVDLWWLLMGVIDG